jgi:broad specificity phosphatase PhoE
VTSVVLVRHAEPFVSKNRLAAEWRLSDTGLEEARALGAHLGSRSTPRIVWTSPERRARDTAAAAFPSVLTRVRDPLGEVKKPWYSSAQEHAAAVALYLEGEVVAGWERREDVIARIAPLKAEIGSLEGVVLVTHGLLLTTWLDHEVGLGDAFSFWDELRMPDAWQLAPGEGSFERIAPPI